MPGPSSSRGSVHRAASQSAAAGALHDRTQHTWPRRDPTIIDQQLGLEAVRISRGDEAEAKAAYVRELGAERVVALGQGTNDAGMLQEAEVGICVLSQESSAIEALMAADLVAPDIHAALELLEYPMRLVASLRR
jgi:hypothetical protein